MNTAFNTTYGNSAAEALPEERARFIRNTYLHLAAAILAFIVFEGFLFASGAAYSILSVMRIGGSMSWLLVLGAFMGVSWLASSWANSQTRKRCSMSVWGFILSPKRLFSSRFCSWRRTLAIPM
jgi:FtsH-binding integral membrane protein